MHSLLRIALATAIAAGFAILVTAESCADAAEFPNEADSPDGGDLGWQRRPTLWHA